MSKLLMAGMMLIGLLASCSENDKSPVEKGTSMKLTLNLTSPTVTKTAITDDPNTTTYIASESTINNVVVALFDASGNIVGSPVSGSLANSQVSVTGTNLVKKVAVAANIPLSAFANVTTLSGFEGKQAVLDSTSTTVAGVAKQSPTKLPMVGEGVVTVTGSGSSFTGAANVALTRLVSKITISGIATHFDPNGAYANASFALTEVFMNNVPSAANCNVTTSTTSAIVNSPTFLHGEQVPTLGLPVAKQKIYLGTGDLTGNITLPWTGNYSFYAFPDSAQASRMQLVVKGIFKMNASDTGVTVYYPIILNHAMSGTTGSTLPNGTDGVILNNKVYSLTATIATKGTTDPTKPIDTAAVTVTLTVAAWPSAITQGTTF
jgi:hypothetical protein